MIMTEREIVLSFRDARDRRRQIGVLAELNGTTQAKIMDILTRNRDMLDGIPLEKYGIKDAAKPRKWTAEKDAKLVKLYADGVPYDRLCVEFGTSVKALYARISTLRREGVIGL